MKQIVWKVNYMSKIYKVYVKYMLYDFCCQLKYDKGGRVIHQSLYPFNFRSTGNINVINLTQWRKYCFALTK